MSHQAAATKIVACPVRSGRDRRDRREGGRLPAGEEDADAEEVGVGHGSLRQRLEDGDPALRPVDGEVGLFVQLGRGLGRRSADAERRLEIADLAKLAEPAEGVEVGAVVAGVDGVAMPSVASSAATAASLPPPPSGRSSSTLRPQCGSKPARPASAAISWARASAARSSAAPRQCRAWIGPLSSQPKPAAARSRSQLELVDEVRRTVDPRGRRARDRGALSGSAWPAAAPGRGCRRRRSRRLRPGAVPPPRGPAGDAADQAEASRSRARRPAARPPGPPPARAGRRSARGSRRRR